MKNTKQRKLKVLQLCAVDVTVEAFLLPLLDRLTAEGYDVKVLCSYGPRTERLREQGYKIKDIEISRRIRPLSLFMSLIRVCRYIKKEKFDIVHTYTPIAGIIGRLAAKFAKVPIVIYTSLGFYFHEQIASKNIITSCSPVRFIVGVILMTPIIFFKKAMSILLAQYI